MLPPTKSWRVSDPASLPHVGVVIPAYRVESQIAEVLRSIPPAVTSIVVVDDASPDRTSEVVRDQMDPRIHLIRREENGGVGAAVLMGYEVAISLGAEIIVKLDGDNQMDPGYIEDLVEPIMRGEADYTKGSRFVHAARLGQMPLLRRVGNVGLSFLTKAASGYWNVFDPANGYTAIHRDVLGELDLDRVDHRWYFETSMLIELGVVRAVARDIYMPAKYGDEQSSLSVRSVLFSFPPRLVVAYVRRVLLQYFIMDFSPVALFLLLGGLLALTGLVWGTVHWVISASTHTAASTGTVMLAVLPLVLGIQLILQAIVLDIQNTPSRPINGRARRFVR